MRILILFFENSYAKFIATEKRYGKIKWRTKNLIEKLLIIYYIADAVLASTQDLFTKNYFYQR